MNIAKTYKGHKITRESGESYQMWFVARKNGKQVTAGYSIREVELKLDRLLDPK